MTRPVLVIPEGVESSDGRSYPPGLLTWRDRYEFMFTDETTEGHLGAVHVGNLENLRRQTVDGVSWIVGDLTYDNDAEAVEAERLAVEDKIRRVSADIATIVEVTGIDEEGFPIMEVVSAEIVGTTQVPMSAFADARILTESETMEMLPPLVAALRPELTEDWFTDPELDGATPFTVTPEGRVYGHLATWGTCHIGFQGACVTPPESSSSYSYFHTGTIHKEDPSYEFGPLEVGVGHITMGTGHASLSAGSDESIAHYDNTGTCVADVCVGEDEHGIWVAGAARPDTDLDALRAASLSGDWRRINGNLELVAALAVNVPGFPIPRTQAAMAAAGQTALVASGVVESEPEPDPIALLVEKVDALSSKLDVYLGFNDEDVEIAGEVMEFGHLALVLDRSTTTA
jgi:hypothetical protein